MIGHHVTAITQKRSQTSRHAHSICTAEPQQTGRPRHLRDPARQKRQRRELRVHQAWSCLMVKLRNASAPPQRADGTFR
jgi:hypothetical protein